MKYVIEDNIPIPPKRPGGGKGKFWGFSAVLAQLEIGQSVVAEKKKVLSAAWRVGRKLNRKFSRRDEGDYCRVWRVE